MILARWTYSREEWRSFLFRHHKKGSLVNTLVRRARFIPRSPEILFSDDAVSVGGKTWPLGHPLQLKEINLYEEGMVNVMRLVFARTEISIPIPRGKLREALDLRRKIIDSRFNDGEIPNSKFQIPTGEIPR